MKMGIIIPISDSHNHNQHDDTLYKTVINGEVVQQFTEEYTLEPWGCPDFEYCYSRPLTKVKAEREGKLFIESDL